MRKFLSIVKSVLVATSVLTAASYGTAAAFTDSAVITGNVFSTGTADLQLLNSLTFGDYDAGANAFSMTAAECVGVCQDTLPGTTFANIFPGWTEQYLLKVVNVGSLNLTLSSLAAYVSGDAALGDHIQVTIRKWDDFNKDGVFDAGEDFGPYGTATLTQWMNNPVGANPFLDLSQINRIGASHEVKGFVFDFAGLSTMPDSVQGQSVTVDFQINGTTTGAPQP